MSILYIESTYIKREHILYRESIPYQNIPKPYLPIMGLIPP